MSDGSGDLLPYPCFERSFHRCDDALVFQAEIEVREADLRPGDTGDQVVHLDDLDVKVAEAAAGEIETEEGRDENCGTCEPA